MDDISEEKILLNAIQNTIDTYMFFDKSDLNNTKEIDVEASKALTLLSKIFIMLQV